MAIEYENGNATCIKVQQKIIEGVLKIWNNIYTTQFTGAKLEALTASAVSTS